MRRIVWWAGLGLGLLAVSTVVLMLVFEWNWLRGYVAQKASAAIGRTVVIEGDLDVDLTWPPLIRVEQVRVANAPWSQEPYMLEIRRLVCRIDLRQLLQGRLVLPMVELVEPVGRLETSEQGEPNWKFGQPPTAAGETASGAVPIIERLSLRDGHLTYHDYASHKHMTATLSEVQALVTGPEQRVEVEGAGQFEGTPFRFAGHGGALQDLHANTPYPLQMQLVVDQWQVDLNGTIAQPLQLQGVAAEVSVARLSPDQPSDSQGQAAPSQAPYRLVGQLTRRETSGRCGRLPAHWERAIWQALYALICVANPHWCRLSFPLIRWMYAT